MSLIDSLRSDTPRMLECLRALVETESPTSDVEATRECAEVAAKIGTDLLGSPPEQIESGGYVHLRWTFGSPRALLLGHLDTVWPSGTLSRWPFVAADGRATGPGVFDMKAGLVQGLFAAHTLDDLDGIAVLFTSDEETGSATSRPIIEDTARGLRGALVLEPSAAGALKVARKGVGSFTLQAHGRASHAGLDPYGGVNALVELAHHVPEIERLADRAAETSVVPTLAAAGTTQNTVPAKARVAIDARAWTLAELERVESGLRGLRPVLPGASVGVETESVRAPLEEGASKDLFALAREIARDLGIGELSGARVGGASDGNFTAALGVPTLDGLGAVGDGAHAEGEHVVIAAMPERAALVAILADRLRR